MTQEEKAKLYDEAIKKAKSKIKNDKDHVLYEDDVIEIFPELAENEDEKIRKYILEVCIETIEADENGLELSMDTTKRLAAWLEKQGEQKQDPCKNCKHVKLNCHNFPCITKRAFEQGKSALEAIKEEKVDNRNYVKPTDKVEPKFKVGDKIRRKTPSSCDKDMQVARIEKDYYICNHIGKLSSEVVPFSKESSYEIIEQTPADMVEPFDKFEGLTDFERTLADICIGWIGEELGWKQYIKDNADVLLKIAIKKFNSVQDAPFEQNTAWSEEDENGLGDALWAIKQARTIAKDENDMGNLWYAENWLKSLRDRVLPQLKKEWSEDDETIAKALTKAANDNMLYGYIGKSKLLDWLKSLKDKVQPQSTWKPSDEQMKSLQESIGIVGELTPRAELLEELLGQLKKLREE